MANAAFYYISEGYQTSGRKDLMGRQAAGEGFLKGFARHSGVDQFYCYGPNAGEFQRFKQTVEAAADTVKPCSFIPFAQFGRLSEVGCLFLPGPGLASDAWVRRTLDSRAYSLCGVTHTTATDRVMDAFGSLLIDPVQSWDAVVCTSQAVKKTVERVLYHYADYLEARIGVCPGTPVQLPVIPLGVDCSQFTGSCDYREKWRNRLRIGDQDIAVLFVGRLSFTTKAHPIPMFLALEEAAKRTGKTVHLLMAGWFDPPTTEKLWKEDVKRYCPSIKAVFLDGRLDEVRREIWSAADIFTSLSDNIQETFGLTPIEAMAAGLPVVVTDWDGYKDTVRQGVDGFRVPVLMPGPGAGEELAVRFANKVDVYGKYCANVSQMTSVDVAACILAYSVLIEDAELRRKMGAAGRQRALAVYDWSNVVNQYQELWKDLGDRRTADTENAPVPKGKPPMPLRLDPFALFQEYPTGYVSPASRVTLLGGRLPGWLGHICSSVMNRYVVEEPGLILAKGQLNVILEYLAGRENSAVGDMIKLFPGTDQEKVIRTVGWLSKNGVIRIYE